MKVVQVCAEFAPIAKAGGMGEALLGLTRELVATHHEVEFFLPKYSWIKNQSLNALNLLTADFRSEERGQKISNSLWSAVVEDCPLTLVESHHPSGYFYREKIYGYEDDAARFLFFCKTVVEYLKARGEEIDVLHLHDWHTACCAALVRKAQIKVRSILLTVHNFEYQGRCASWDLEAIGVQPEPWFRDDQVPGAYNLLKAGICCADAVSTVSPSYAKESFREGGAHGLGGFLKKKAFTGILNGICVKSWNPEEDVHLCARYSGSFSSTEIALHKNQNKKLLQTVVGLECGERPLFGVIMRLTPSKGSHLIASAVETVLEEGGSFVLLGYSPIPEIQVEFDMLKERYRHQKNVFFGYRYEDALAHQIYAASDFFLIPSVSEPCGLTQLIALRYGAIPIVHATGGLRDTVFDYEDASVVPERRNGIVFRDATEQALRQAIRRAIVLKEKEAVLFDLTQKRAMKGDYSWKKGGGQYSKLYHKLLRT